MLDGELPAREVALEGEVGEAHRGRSCRRSIAAARVSSSDVTDPTDRHRRLADRARRALRRHGAHARPSSARLGLRDRLAAEAGARRASRGSTRRRRQRPGLGRRPRSAGEEPRPHRRLSAAPRRAMSQTGLRPAAATDARLLVLGGDCTTHAGAMAGIRRARPGIRLGLAWFDAHGDFNTPDTTPSGNVWGMPFAMACGRGDADLWSRRRRARRSRELDAGAVRRPGPRRDRVADARRERRRAVRRRDAGGRRRSGRRRRRGRARSRSGSTPGTSPSTWTRSTPPAAGLWRCPSPTGLARDGDRHGADRSRRAARRSSASGRRP